MHSLIVMTLSGSALALLLIVLRRWVLPKMPSTVYYYAWLLVLLRLALPLPGLIRAPAEAVPFRDCEDLRLTGFTAGHTKEPGVCSGGVLMLQNCGNVRVEDCRLYGCGILGIQGSSCVGLTVLRTEIFECSQGAASFYKCDGISFSDCDVHDVPDPAFTFNECGDKSWNGEPVTGTSPYYILGEDGKLYVIYLEQETVTVGLAELNNPFAEVPPESYPADSPEARFAASVQRAIADGDWETLSGKLSYPLVVYGVPNGPGGDRTNLTIDSAAQFIENADRLFPEEFRARVANASPELIGQSVFGFTCCDHLIAFSCFGAEIREDNLLVTAISLDTPFWPGRNGDVLLEPAPTPQP